MVEVLHHGFKQPDIDFEFLEGLRKVEDLVDILDFGDPVRDEFVLLVESLNLFEMVAQLVLVDVLVGTLGAEAVLKSPLN